MKYALTALVYLNSAGAKIRTKAGSIIVDASDADVERWESNGNVREATVGEVAEAIAAGTLDPKYAPGAPKKKAGADKDADKAAADKAAADKAAADMAAADKAAAGENGGAPKRQDIV